MSPIRRKEWITPILVSRTVWDILTAGRRAGTPYDVDLVRKLEGQARTGGRFIERDARLLVGRVISRREGVGTRHPARLASERQEA